MERQFTRIGSPFTRIDAVDPEALVARGLANAHMLPNQFGCQISHLDAARALLASADSHAAIFEDDVFLADDAAQYLQDSGWIPDDADVVKLETKLTRCFQSRSARPAPGGRQLHRLLSRQLGAGAYILSRKAAATLVSSKAENWRDFIDIVLFDPKSQPSPRWSVWQLS